MSWIFLIVAFAMGASGTKRREALLLSAITSVPYMIYALYTIDQARLEAGLPVASPAMRYPIGIAGAFAMTLFSWWLGVLLYRFREKRKQNSPKT